jgi:hypothetical protein
MNETVTATYESETKVKNVVEALIDSIGIPQEKIFVDKASKQVKVIIPAATESEVKRVMQSHQPTNMSERVWDS